MAVDLTTSYLGLRLRNPLVVGAGPLTSQLDRLLLLEQAGAAAFVLPSLFEEQIQQDIRSTQPDQSPVDTRQGPSLSQYPAADDFTTTPDAYLRLIEGAKKTVSSPVIGSLNGVTPGGWTRFAALMESAGADALELNMYALETDQATPSQMVEERYLDLVRSVRETISIPLAVKLGPFFTAFANFATRLAEAGADGLVLFNRFFQPDIDVEKLEVVPTLRLSESSEVRVPLRWIALLHGNIDVDLAATTGVHSGHDLIKYLLAGAGVAMITSAVIQQGHDVVSAILQDLEAWLQEHQFSSVDEIRGLLDQKNCLDKSAFERANYMKALLQNIS